MDTALRGKIRARRALPPPAIQRAIRQSIGVTQQDIADELGVSLRTVVRWEHGDTTPRGEVLVRYVRLIDEMKAEASHAAG